MFVTAARYYDADACSRTIFPRSTSCPCRDESKIWQLFCRAGEIFSVHSGATKCHRSYTQMSPGSILPTWHFLSHFKATVRNQICKLV